MTNLTKVASHLREMQKEGLSLGDLADAIEKVAKMYPNSIASTNQETIDDGFLKLEITRIMHEIGIPAKTMGHDYIRRGIELAFKNPNLKNAITKDLYSVLAKEFNSTPTRVERTIRHAIETAWTRGKPEVLERYFGYTINPEKGKPTNNEFISMIADSLRLKYKL